MPIRNNFDINHLEEFSKKFDNHFVSYVQKQTSPDQRIKKALLYFIKTGGKRIRPFIISMLGDFFSLNKNSILDLAVAVECVHLHSLIHDDLPAMDNDDFRRGKPTVHKKFDEATAVLAGDLFQVLSIKRLSETHYLNDKQKIKSINLLTSANGFKGLIAGQSLDIYMKKNSSLKQIEVMYAHKTGALFNLCFELPAQFIKLNPSQKKDLKVLSNTLGLIFQLTDDMLDRWGDEKKVGKKINKDSKKASIAYKLNYQDCSAYLNQVQIQNFKALHRFFIKDINAATYMSSFMDYVANRVS
jgi:geranylgeranyl pyrophosphate synthase